MTKKVKRYSEEFKAEAVKAIENNGGNVSGTARQLGLPMQKLANWQRKANQGKLKGTKQFDSELMAVIEENKRLKRELKIAQEEREILKKATAYFARNGLSVSNKIGQISVNTLAFALIASLAIVAGPLGLAAYLIAIVAISAIATWVNTNIFSYILFEGVSQTLCNCL